MTSHDLGRKYCNTHMVFTLFIPRSGCVLTWADPVGSDNFSKWEGEGSYRNEERQKEGKGQPELNLNPQSLLWPWESV